MPMSKVDDWSIIIADGIVLTVLGFGSFVLFPNILSLLMLLAGIYCLIRGISEKIKSRSENTLDIYTSSENIRNIETSRESRSSSPFRWWLMQKEDNVTPLLSIEEVGKYAECPYCSSNIRDTFFEHGGVVRCDKCGALHHKECFEYYGRKCGSPSCKLRDN